MFLTHGEEETRAAFKQALVAAGCDGSKIFLPQLDDSFDLMAATIHAPKERRLPQEVVGRHDWHNSYAALVLDLRQRLDALPDDKARAALLAQIQKTLGPPAAHP
jgi:metallo-beta-lactamase family protein